MMADTEAETGAIIIKEDPGGVDPRVTCVGGVLRQNHLDEIPQLWSVLVDYMSVVVSQPKRQELDANVRTGMVN